MKRRCVPLRADHNLLTPDTHTVSGVRLHSVIHVRSEGAASLSDHLSDLTGNKSSISLPRRRTAASPTRRLRFEDETEKEAESRYLERQRQRRPAGQRVPAVLNSKPDLKLYISGRVEAGLPAAGTSADRKQRGATGTRAGQCDSCGTSLGGVALNHHLHPTPPVSYSRGRSQYRLDLRTESIKETYIGVVTPTDISKGGEVPVGLSNMLVRRTSQMELNGNQGTLISPTSITELPINPYAPEQLFTPTPKRTSGRRSEGTRLNGTRADQSQHHNQEEQGRPAGAKPHRELPSRVDKKEKSASVDPRTQNSSGSETAVDNQTPPIPHIRSDGQARQPMRTDCQSDITALPKQFCSRDDSRRSLRRLFSNVSLSRARTSSLDRFTSRPRPAASINAQPDPAHPVPRNSSCALKNSMSVQSLSVESPFLQLRKSLSVQSFGSEQQKTKRDRSADYKPVAHCHLQRCLSVEDVGRPSSLRSVGRVLQVGSDGTFLLELSRPKSETYGFIISRGRGRPDSGVYVEDMVDSSTEKLYAGLLAVGDEILEVNGEKVASLSLDQVSSLLTKSTSTTVQVLRHWRPPPQ